MTTQARETTPIVLSVDLNGIPEELKKWDQWVVWKMESRNGSPTKIPYSPLAGTCASSIDPETWGSFTDATAALRLNAKRWSGIGFVFTKDDPFVGIDLDHCVDAETGAILPWTDQQREAWPNSAPDPQAICNSVASYAELSPSGTGIKIFAKASLDGGRRKMGDFEAYDRGRYFTMTGRRLSKSPPEVAEDASIVPILCGMMGADKPKSKAKRKGKRKKSSAVRDGHSEGRLPTDEMVYAKAVNSRSGLRIRKLWDGTTSDYPSPSEAEAALVAHLAFYTDDPAQIDRLMRQTKLYRDKWDELRGEQTYLERTIVEGIAIITDRYDWTKDRAYRKAAGKSSDNHADADIEEADRDHETDLGNARRLVRLHGANIRYCHPWGKWLNWDGRRWCIDQTGAIERRAKDTIKKLWLEVAACEEQGERDRLVNHAMRSESAQRIAAMVTLARTEENIPILPETLDSDVWLLNVENGTVDLRTGELRPHSKDDLITKLAPTVYDPDAKSPLWEKFVSEVFDGHQELIAYVQRLFGCCLSGSISEQILPVLHGRGANGKSTLINAVLDIMGKDYSLKAPPDFLMVKRNSHPTELTDLFGRRLVVAAETEEGRRLAESLVKELTGSEKIRARRMREDFWEFDPTHKLLLCTNHKPEVKGTDHGIWRRLQLIPFKKRFEEQDQDKLLPKKLAAESSGILAWLVRGCLAWQNEKGLNAPQVVDAATEKYRKEQDALSKFFEECCILDNVGRVQASALLKAFHDWAGEKTLTQKRLAAILEERGFDKVSIRNRSFWLGIELVADRDPQSGLGD